MGKKKERKKSALERREGVISHISYKEDWGVYSLFLAYEGKMFGHFMEMDVVYLLPPDAVEDLVKRAEVEDYTFLRWKKIFIYELDNGTNGTLMSWDLA